MAFSTHLSIYINKHLNKDNNLSKYFFNKLEKIKTWINLIRMDLQASAIQLNKLKTIDRLLIISTYISLLDKQLQSKKHSRFKTPF